MTISAQVIDLSSSGLMITCINRCVLMISLAMPGIRNGICNGCFYSTKGRAWGAIFAKGSCCWPPAICATPISGSTISASSMALIRNRLLPASLPGPSISRRAPTAKRTTVAPTEARLSWFTARGKTSDATPSAAPDTQWRPALRTTDKTAPYRAG